MQSEKANLLPLCLNRARGLVHRCRRGIAGSAILARQEDEDGIQLDCHGIQFGKRPDGFHALFSRWGSRGCIRSAASIACRRRQCGEDAKAGVVVWADAPSLLIMSRATNTPAAASTIAPITQRVLPGVPVALQPHPGPQAEACCFSNSMLSVCFLFSFDVFIVLCSLCFVFVINRDCPLHPAFSWRHSRHRLACPRPLCRRNTDRKPPPDC